jgi:membrane associated rhomboid family serine protease
VIPLKDNIPTSRFPIVTVVLITLNVLAFVWQLSLSGEPGSASGQLSGASDLSERDAAALEYGAIPFRITHPGDECEVASRPESASAVICAGTPAAREITGDPNVTTAPLDAIPWWLTVITSMFLHAGFLHLAGNMLFLWVFGNNVEDSMSRGRFVAFYLLSGVVAVYAQALLDIEATGPTIGASGAVAGVLGGYALLYPQARVLTMVILPFFLTWIEIPAMVMLGIWFALQFLPVVGQLAIPDVVGDAGIAYLAHVGGFLFGLAVIRPFANRWRQKLAGTPHPVH